eukprot:CAMPEP_0179266616 /NCGR_PEP_ID=MMETSP0797-20121207/29507_1 /TAXON_ID=47934 /ORGANISM="Dinophysis acuminata, Strain DAEP01" /LENGTH=205 /DNA_ID=CAMNT_0020974853 /DNA_START=60 /DNA_END=674 /DNA_ORIENTATION=-
MTQARMTAVSCMQRDRRPLAAKLHKACEDARVSHTGRYSGWLTKVKGDNAKMKTWISNSTSRYFTIDFDARTFSYSYTESAEETVQAIHFADILYAEQFASQCGFAVRTAGRVYELHTASNRDAARWVSALSAARELGAEAAGGLADFRTVEEEEERFAYDEMDLAECMMREQMARAKEEAAQCAEEERLNRLVREAEALTRSME